MAIQRVISADSHMTEPGDLWVKRLDRKYRDHAPRVIKKRRASSRTKRPAALLTSSSAPDFIRLPSPAHSPRDAAAMPCASI